MAEYVSVLGDVCCSCKQTRLTIYDFRTHHRPIPKYCSRCKQPGMINARRYFSSRRCLGCWKNQATYADKGVPAMYCRNCKDENMVRW
jgi:hypothetical protein